jgi:hypothetical protein
MAMTTTLTLVYEGAPACIDCQRLGVPVCDHVGFHPEAWDHVQGETVNAPGLDPRFVHVVRAIDIAPDRKTLTYTVETDRPPMLELGRHLSILTDHTIKAVVRAEHHETGEVLADGRYDAFLREGQEVCINGLPHVVVGEPQHPNRHPEYGTCRGDQPDLQVAKLAPISVEPIQVVTGGTS